MTTTTFAGVAGKVVQDDGAARADILIFLAIWFALVVIFVQIKRFRGRVFDHRTEWQS